MLLRRSLGVAIGGLATLACTGGLEGANYTQTGGVPCPEIQPRGGVLTGDWTITDGCAPYDLIPQGGCLDFLAPASGTISGGLSFTDTTVSVDLVRAVSRSAQVRPDCFFVTTCEELQEKLGSGGPSFLESEVTAQVQCLSDPEAEGGCRCDIAATDRYRHEAAITNHHQGGAFLMPLTPTARPEGVQYTVDGDELALHLVVRGIVLHARRGSP